jgi:hypothetical protein
LFERSGSNLQGECPNSGKVPESCERAWSHVFLVSIAVYGLFALIYGVLIRVEHNGVGCVVHHPNRRASSQHRSSTQHEVAGILGTGASIRPYSCVVFNRNPSLIRRTLICCPFICFRDHQALTIVFVGWRQNCAVPQYEAVLLATWCGTRSVVRYSHCGAVLAMWCGTRNVVRYSQCGAVLAV